MDNFERRNQEIADRFWDRRGDHPWARQVNRVKAVDGCTLLVEPLPYDKRYPSKAANAKTVELLLARGACGPAATAAWPHA